MARLELFWMVFIGVLVIPIVCADVLEVSVEYEAGQFRLNKSAVYATGNIPGMPLEDSPYLYRLLSVDGNILAQGNVVIPGPVIIERDWVNNVPAEVIDTPVKQISLYMRYNATLKGLEVYDENGSILLGVDLSSFNRCNLNGVCDANENKVLCPRDCRDSAKDGVCTNFEDGVCAGDPDCVTEDIDCRRQAYEEQMAEQAKNPGGAAGPKPAGVNNPGGGITERVDTLLANYQPAMLGGVLIIVIIIGIIVTVKTARKKAESR